MSIPLQWIALYGALSLVLAAVVVAGLKVLQHLDSVVPPIGARRVAPLVEFGAPLSMHDLPRPVAERMSSGKSLLVFAGPSCCLCDPVLAALPNLTTSAQVVVITWHPWDPFQGRSPGKVTVAVAPDFIDALGLSLQPFGLWVVRGKIVDAGIVNSPDQVESLLESEGPPWLRNLEGAAG